MSQENLQPKQEKQVLTMEEIEFINGDLQEKYEELLRSTSLLESEKNKWEAAFDEYNDFYNNAPCGYHIFDDTGLILNINQTELKWLGYTREEVVNKKNLMDIISQKSGLVFFKEMPLLRDKGFVDQIEVEYVRKDGTVFQALVSARAIYDENKVFKCGRSTVWDITERKKMEDEMYNVTRHLRAIKERFEEKNTFLQKVNEELQLVKKEQNELYAAVNNSIELPLDRALTLCNTLLSTLSMPAADLQKKLGEIEAIISEVYGFVNNYMVRQRMSSDLIYLQKTRFSLSNLLINVVNRLEEQASKKKISINCEIFEAVMIESDKELATQLFDMLLTRVIRFSAPGKEIPLRLIQKANEDLVELEINGLSINSNEFTQLFDKNIEALSDIHSNEAKVAMSSHLINSLIENLGYTLTSNPINHKGSLIRLAIPRLM
ncbi:MAG: PAS domain S-box protein [Bacteroidia bacterium]